LARDPGKRRERVLSEEVARGRKMGRRMNVFAAQNGGHNALKRGLPQVGRERCKN